MVNLFPFMTHFSKEWVQCPGDENCTDVCQFHGDDSKKLKVKLSSSAPQSRTFFTEEFTLNQTSQSVHSYIYVFRCPISGCWFILESVFS